MSIKINFGSLKTTSQQAVLVSQGEESASRYATDLLEMPWNSGLDKKAKHGGSNGVINQKPHSMGFGMTITVENAKRMRALKYRTSPSRLKRPDEKQLEFHWQ